MGSVSLDPPEPEELEGDGLGGLDEALLAIIETGFSRYNAPNLISGMGPGRAKGFRGRNCGSASGSEGEVIV